MRRRPGLFRPGSRRSAFLAPALTATVALAVVGGLAVLPGPLDRIAPVANDRDWYEDTAAEQLRQDQCLMAEVLRLGGPAMGTTAQNGLNQSPEGLHTAANRKYWETTPLSTSFTKDQEAADKQLAALDARRDGWKQPVYGLANPAGFTGTEFHWPPGSNDGKQDFHSQTGLTQWIADRFWKDEGDFYEDPTPKADEKTRQAVTDLGNPLYGKDPDASTSTNWARDVAENEGFKWLRDATFEPTGADNARLFLSSGGFPRTAPAPGTAEHRIAVEDLKTRFASCAWRDPIDPNKVLGDISTTAAVEWQQEIASQAAQRNQVVNAGNDATKALAKGAEALGQMLGHSWVADHLARWQDFWSAGGVGWIGDASATIELTAAKGKCLEVQGGGTANGTAVQAYTCNGTPAQAWQMEGDDLGLHLRNVKSLKCLDVAGNGTADGTKIQIHTCNSSPAQTWEYTPRATTALKGVGSGKCLNFATYDLGKDALLATCKAGGPQQLTIKPSGHTGDVQPKAHFDQATKGITDAKAGAKAQLAVLKQQAAAAKTAVTSSDAAVQAAYAVADKNGAPRGRGLLVGLQKAQVTKGVAAALDAMVKAGETAEAATRAAVADSETIAQRALTQAAQSKAEFRKEAARTAELQAKAAADGAKLHRDNAKKDKETAEAKLALALKAEGDAKAAAAEAHAKRLAAEAEEATAKAEKDTAAAKQGEAAQHKANAEAEATKAEDAKRAAEASESTAVEKKNAAVKARDNAKAKRDDAWEAEQRADAAAAKAAAKEAFAQAHESDANAKESREAADAAWGHADDAEAAAGRARGEADLATEAAAEADAAATRAEAAAKRSRAHADDAQAAKLKADAAVRTATSAAADAIDASEHAAAEAQTAVKLADEAEAKAKEAMGHAVEADKEAATARATAAKAAGFAYVTAQAAADAGAAAAQVAKPANDAIQLGSPYVTTDATAGLVVLTGQASKTIAEQQNAVAQIHAENAKAEAAAAKALADKATGDAKQAYVHAANAAGYAAEARGYAKEALGYAAEAAKAASLAVASLARTVEYDRKATEDAEAADRAAGRAEGHARSARDSADQAALDAEGARDAASRAEQSAKDAKAAAQRADTAATEAEEAAKDALKYAKEAQEAADSAARKQANQQIQNGAGTGGVGGTFFVIDEDSMTITDAKPHEPCELEAGFEGCTVMFTVTFDVKVDFYLCTNPDVPPTESGCPSTDTQHLDTQLFTGLKKDVSQYFSKWDLIKQTLVYQVLKEVLVQDFVDCWHGSVGGCAWAASNFIPGKAFGKIAEAFRALDAALKTGTGIRDAFNALKALDVDPATLARIENQINVYEDVFVACERNSFPGDTRVLMADGSHRSIRDVRVGDRVLATDTRTGGLRAEDVTDTFRHDTERLVDISVDGGLLTSTAGHRFLVLGRGWTTVAELRVGDRLRTPQGTEQTVTALRDRSGLAPRTVFDLTVDGTHTFYVRPQGERVRDVLVHNCTDIIGDEDVLGAHTLGQHVNRTNAQMQAKADEAVGGIAGRWTDQATAARAVAKAMEEWVQQPGNAQKLADWKLKQAQKVGKGKPFVAKDDCLPIRWQLRDEGSLGKVWRRGGEAASPEAAGNTVQIMLRYAPKVKGQGQHTDKYVVYTSYPLPN